MQTYRYSVEELKDRYPYLSRATLSMIRNHREGLDDVSVRGTFPFSGPKGSCREIRQVIESLVWRKYPTVKLHWSVSEGWFHASYLLKIEGTVGDLWELSWSLDKLAWTLG